MNKSFQAPRVARQNGSGFSLVELLVTMVILSIIVAIAVPNYMSFARQSRRTDAKNALLNLASMEERYFSINNVYTNVPTNLGYNAAAGVSFNVGSGYYQITTLTATAATAPTTAAPAGVPASYTITATPVPGGLQVGDTACTSFTITSGGAQSATPAANSTTCWQN
ncbi:MAG: type IV pilin protein [Steroidobacteraceae bacterium]